MKYVRPKEAASILGVAVSSLRRWEEEGKIKAIKTPSGHRRYSIKEIEQAADLPRSITTVCYARVSSHSQRDDLKGQIELLRSRFPEAEIISEIGSGLNFKRKRFLSILDRVLTGDIERLIVAHSDRLVRFGFELVKWLCERHECELLVLNDNKLSPEQELVQDMLSIIHSVRGFTDYEDPKKKSKKKYGKSPYKKSKKVQPNSVLKVPVWPSYELHKIWKQWLAAYRWVYNQCIEFFNQQETLPKSRSLDQVIQSRQSQPENKWTKCLGKTRQEAVCEAEQAYKQARAANNDQNFQLRYRSCRKKSQVIQFKNDAYRDGTWFPKKVKNLLFCTAIGYQIPRNCDYGTELVYQRGQWFACLTQYIEPTTTGSDKVIALDPGNRAFLTGYDGENVLEIGKGDIGQINRLCSHLDKLLSRAALSKNKRQRYQMRKAAARMRSRIQYLVKDLHNKVASVLVNSYKLIFLPTYETSQMVLKSRRKIHRKSVRNMLTWSHGKFADRLEQMADRKGVLVVRCNEAYTSKTCTNCGHVHNKLGGDKIYKCPQCGHVIPRDINGARNIMLRALQATAFTVVNNSIVISDARSTEAL